MDGSVARAREYATSAHARIDQLRKYSHQPYDVHLRAVAALVASVADDQAMIAAAWLHDVVEDTPATFEDIEREFGAEVMALVKELTDVSRPGDGNRAARKAIDREHLARGSARAKTIKLADIVDNCADICRHDPKFARVYLAEARALLEVLHEGDSGLHAKAAECVEECDARIGTVPAAASQVRRGAPPMQAAPAGSHGIRLFAEAFSARDIQEPLRSHDHCSLPTLIGEGGLPGGTPVVGIRHNGLVTGYLPLAGEARVSPDAVRAIDPQQIVGLDAPLADVIHVLTQFAFCFVAMDGATVGVIARKDIEKPVVRMWLFGIIILTEALVVAEVRRVWPGESWVQHLSEGRLAKARQLQTERERRGLGADLLDCLQFSDKLQLVLNHPPFVEQLGFPSLGAARKIVKDLESLRNNLAHGQDITRHDWPQIARLARRIQSAFGA